MVKNSILDIDPNEIVLHEIKRHPIGIYLIVGTSALIFTVLLVGLFILVKGGGADVIGETMLSAVFVALGVLLAILTYIAVTIYKTNELIITNENLVQILQQSVFDRKLSQLNLAKVQDVTVDQEGVLATIFGYGTIKVETAGEATNYNFTFSPNPNINAKFIIEAHEQYLRTNHIDSQNNSSFAKRSATRV